MAVCDESSVSLIVRTDKYEEFLIFNAVTLLIQLGCENNWSSVGPLEPLSNIERQLYIFIRK